MHDVWRVGSAAGPYPPNDAKIRYQRKTKCGAVKVSSAALQPRAVHALQCALRHKRLPGRQHVMLVRNYATEVRMPRLKAHHKSEYAVLP